MTSRKKVYVPRYFEYMHQKEMTQEYKSRALKKDIVVFDFDGPRTDTGEVSCVEVTLDLLREKYMTQGFLLGMGTWSQRF